MADARAIGAAIDACARAYPGATMARVEQLLWTFYERTTDARVQQYRVLLAERETRAQLRRDERTHLGGRTDTGHPARQDLVVLDGTGPEAADEASSSVPHDLHHGLAGCTP